jgi:ubiquinone/menaquinone biosynthesis C-methylase UbiE
VADDVFEHPRLAEIYDAVDGDRADLAAYVALADEVGARSILDVGCGTGTLACMLAERERTVVAVDPAAASLAVARRKPHADRVQWVEGTASELPAIESDLVTMTGNVAQVFLTDDEWLDVLRCARRALRPSGHLAFEARRPEARAWTGWTKRQTERRVPIGTDAWVCTWIDLISADLPFVSFRHVFRFEHEDEVLTSTSTLRFRTHDEIARALAMAGFTIDDVREAPDRPGLEHVFIATRAS